MLLTITSTTSFRVHTGAIRTYARKRSTLVDWPRGCVSGPSKDQATLWCTKVALKVNPVHRLPGTIVNPQPIIKIILRSECTIASVRRCNLKWSPNFHHCTVLATHTRPVLHHFRPTLTSLNLHTRLVSPQSATWALDLLKPIKISLR